MLKWAMKSRGSPTSSSGLPETTSGGEIENYVSASRAAAWPTYNDVSVAQPSEVRWSTQWLVDDSDDDRDSLSAYNDNSSALEQMMAIDFNDDSHSSADSSADRTYDRQLWLSRQIEREQKLRTGADTLLQATCNDKWRSAIVAELFTINRNLQLMKEERVELSLHKQRAGMSQSEWLIDCAGCSPMVALHFKQTRDVDFKPALVGYVSSHYYEVGEKYSVQFNRLTEMRRLCCDPSWADQHVEHLFAYYNQLYFVDRRFFPSRHDGRTSFDWYDSFSGARSSQKSIAFEKGSILFNIGVLYAQKGARRNRRTVSGLEASATDFRLSSGVFRFLRDNFQHAPSEDMQAPVVNVLVQLTLSQARECVLQQLLLDRSPGGATDQQNDLLRYVELAQECSTLAASHSELITVMSTTPLQTRLPLVWEELMRCKRGYYSSLAHYNIALALLELSFVVDVEQTSRLILVLMNAHSRVAAAAELTLRRPVYSDTAVETSRGRLLLAKAHIRQSILSSEEAMKIVTERHELEELRSLLQKVHDRSLRKFSELELEDDFTELRLAPDVCARTKLHVEPIPPDFVQYKVDDLFHQLGCLSIFSARHDWTPPRPVTLIRQYADEELGFTVRGEAPVIVATVDDSSPAQMAGVRVSDFIVGVGDVDVKWARHEKVVSLIRDAGLTVRLSLVTPVDRNFIESGVIFSSRRNLESSSVSSLDVKSDLDVDTVSDEPRHASHERRTEIETATLSRHWGFRRRRKREKNS